MVNDVIRTVAYLIFFLLYLVLLIGAIVISWVMLSMSQALLVSIVIIFFGSYFFARILDWLF